MSTTVKAEIPATVWQVRVEVGDQVAADDELVVLESMKMEIPVFAPSRCRDRGARGSERPGGRGRPHCRHRLTASPARSPRVSVAPRRAASVP